MERLGDDAVHAHVPPGLLARLRESLGPAQPPSDVTLAEALSRMPESQLTASALFSVEPEARLRHARGQSFGDLIAMRSGQIGRAPDAVATPESNDEVRALLAFARTRGARLIPWGGGTSVVGHVNPGTGAEPIVTVDLGRLRRLESLEPLDRLATFGAGVAGPDLEAQLRARGFMLGHFPQSFELSTLGGWIATRSRGQQSLGYGRIEELFAGGHVETPRGPLELLPHPSSSAGPDLRELVLGSEGRLGVITQATVHVQPVPPAEEFAALLFPDWERALSCVRGLAQDNPGLSMVRLSAPEETALHLSMALPQAAGPFVDGGLSLVGFGAGRCLLVMGASGTRRQVDQSLGEARAQASGALPVPLLGAAWARARFKNPYLRNALWEHGYGVETVETCTRFSLLAALRDDLERSLRAALSPLGERAEVFTHLSHVYPSGANVYTTFVFRLGDGAGQALARWQALKSAACEAIVRQGATISHQHGVGVDHKAHLAAEKGTLGVEALRTALGAFDPEGLLNPGKLC